MDSQYLTPKMMEQHLTLLHHLKSEAVAPMPLSTLKTARSALRSSGYNLQTNRESSYMDDDDMLYHQAGAPNMYHHPPSYFDCAPVKNNVQCSYEFLENNRDSCQTNQIYCNTSANCVPQEAMDALKWAIEGIQKLKVLPKQEILSQPFKAFDKSEGKEVNFDLSSVSGDGASNRKDIEGSLISEQATKRSNSETEKDMQLNQLIDLVRLTILKLDSYITLSQKEQQQMNQNQQGNQLNIEPYLMSTELRPHVDMITDPALQSMLFNKVRQKVRLKRTVKVMPVQPLVIIHPSTPPPPDPPSTQAANTTRPADRYRVRKRRRHGGIESSHYNSVKNKRDCGTTMWCPNPDCQCSNGLSSQQHELRLDLPQSQSCGTRKNIMSVGKEMDMRSTALPMLLKKLLKRHKCCDELRSESPLSYTEDVQADEQQREHEQEVDSDQDWEYPTGYREYELEPEEEEWSHLPDNMCSCKRRQRETSEASSQADYPKRKQRKCVRTVQKSSLKSKGCNKVKVKFNKRVIVKNLTDDEHERPKCAEYKTERAAPSGRTRSSKCRVLKSMWEADQKRSSLAEEYSRRSKGGAESMLPSHYPTKWTQ